MSTQIRTVKRKKTEVLNIRLNEGIKAMMSRLADLEDRNVSNWLEVTVKRLYKEAGFEDAPEELKAPEPTKQPARAKRKKEPDQDEIPAVLISQGRHSIKPE